MSGKKISEAGRIEACRRVDPLSKRGAKDIQLPAISGSRLARELMPFLTATAQEIVVGRVAAAMDLDGFLASGQPRSN